MLLTLGTLLAMPLSILLILSAAVGSGVSAAVWFTIRTGRSARTSVCARRDAGAQVAIPLPRTVVETDAQPELAEKLG